MATYGQAYTLADVAKAIDPNTNSVTTRIVEMLNQKNEVLDDITFIESNLPTTHQSIVRTSLASAGLRIANQGVAIGKNTSAQVTEGMARIELPHQVDAMVAELNGDVAAFRMLQGKGVIESISQYATQLLWYGNANITNEAFTGFSPRYASLSGATGQNILSAGGSGSNLSSIWLVNWDGESCTGIYPKGSKAGIDHQPFDKQVLRDASNNPYTGYVDIYSWQMGLSLADWRQAVRVCNIPNTNAALFATTYTADLITYMMRAIDRLPNVGANAAFYMNRTMKSALMAQATFRQASVLTVEAGRRSVETKFMGIPIRLTDQLLSTETTIS